MDKVRFSIGPHVFQGFHDGKHGMAGSIVLVTADTLRQVTEVLQGVHTTDFDRLHNAPNEDWATLAFGSASDSINPDSDVVSVTLAPDRVTPLYELVAAEPTIVQRFDPAGGRTYERHFGEGNVELVPYGVWVNEETLDGFFVRQDAWEPICHGFVIDAEAWANGRGDAPPIDTERAVAARAEAEESTPDLLDPEGSGYVAEAPWDAEPISDEMIGRISRAVDAADDAFWAVVARDFPEIKSGDFDPGSAVAREQRNLDDVQEWVEGNTPDPEPVIEGKEYVVDVLVPIAITVMADDEEMAASMALESLENEGVRARIQDMVDSDDSSFTISDSDAQTEVGEA